jgi:hypothetical protein
MFDLKLQHCINFDSINSTFFKMLHRDYFITYWKSEIDYLKRTRHDFNEESFFDIKRIDRKYDDYSNTN